MLYAHCAGRSSVHTVHNLSWSDRINLVAEKLLILESQDTIFLLLFHDFVNNSAIYVDLITAFNRTNMRLMQHFQIYTLHLCNVYLYFYTLLQRFFFTTFCNGIFGCDFSIDPKEL